MLTAVQVSNHELEMLKLMVDFLAEKPELCSIIECCTTPYYALTKTFSEYFDLPEADAWKIFEELEKKIQEAQYVHVKGPDPIKKWLPISAEEINMFRVVTDYFAPQPKMSPASGFVSNRLESVIETYKWFFGTSEGNGEVARESFHSLIEKAQKATSLRCGTLAPIVTNA